MVVRIIDQNVFIKVKDNGPGIAPEIEPYLFEPFRTNKDGGTGLGLAVVHRIVEGHGGTVKVVSSATGTEFSVRLPLRPHG